MVVQDAAIGDGPVDAIFKAVERVTGVRKTFAQEMGVIIPPIRLRDNLQLEANQYRFLLKGNPIVQGELMPGHWLAMNASHAWVRANTCST